MTTSRTPMQSLMHWTIIVVGGIAACLIMQGRLQFTTPRSPGAASIPSNDARETPLVFAGGVVEGSHLEIPLRFEIAGRLRSRLVAEGDTVKAGCVLAELDSEAAELALKEARLRLKIAAAERDSRINESPRMAGRPTSGPVIATATKQGEVDSTADSNFDLATLAVQREQLMVERHRLRAPCDGVVLLATAQVGQLVGPADEQPLITMVDRDRTHVHAFVEELDALDVAPGQMAVTKAAGKPDQHYRGTVITCSAQLRPKTHRHLHPGERLDTRMREVVIELDDGSDLLIGLPVDVYIKTKP